MLLGRNETISSSVLGPTPQTPGRQVVGPESGRGVETDTCRVAVQRVDCQLKTKGVVSSKHKPVRDTLHQNNRVS